MRKIYATAAFAAMALAASAQTNPNRVLVRETSGNVQGFLAERIDSIYFAKVEGRIAADVTYNSFSNSDEGATIDLAVKKTEGCYSFRICCLSSNLAGQLTTDAQKASYVERYGTEKLYDDFSGGAQMTIPATDMTFADGTKYTIMTVGYDGYDIACGVSQTEFETPKASLTGNPSVEYTVNEVTPTSFTITLTPNADCAGYAVCSFPEGTIESTFSSMGAFFGYANIGDMIKGWSGQNYTGKNTIPFTSMTPGQGYDVAIQPWDKNGNYADYIVCNVKTKANGGSGTALVSFDIPSEDFYKYNDNGTLKYYQRVVFTPNDQTNIYHNMLVERSYFDKDPDYYWNYLTEDLNMVGWDRTGIDDDKWEVKPETEYYALAMAKNANGEYGDKCMKLFKTATASQAVDMPTTYAPKATATKAMPARFGNGASATKGAIAPKFFAKKGITVVAK